MNLAGFLIGIAGSLAGRVLIALGIGIVSFAALTTMVTTVIAQIQTQYNAIPANILTLLNLGGMGDFMAIIASAFVVRVSLISIKRFRLLS